MPRTGEMVGPAHLVSPWVAASSRMLSLIASAMAGWAAPSHALLCEGAASARGADQRATVWEPGISAVTRLTGSAT